MKSERRTITVAHPKYGETTVKGAANKLDAVIEAARRWKAQWSVLARECTFYEGDGGKGDDAQ